MDNSLKKFPPLNIGSGHTEQFIITLGSKLDLNAYRISWDKFKNQKIKNVRTLLNYIYSKTDKDPYGNKIVNLGETPVDILIPSGGHKENIYHFSFTTGSGKIYKTLSSWYTYANTSSVQYGKEKKNDYKIH